MYDVKQFKEQTEAITEAHDICSRIVAHAKNHREKYGKYCEISMMKLYVGHCLTPEIGIEVWLNSKPDRWGVRDAEEKREAESLNKRARIFVSKLLAEFKAKGTRDSQSPETLRLQIRERVTLHIHGFPTKVTYECQKKCVAVLPDGTKKEISELAVEL
jgi:hypothetical protein